MPEGGTYFPGSKERWQGRRAKQSEDVFCLKGQLGQGDTQREHAYFGNYGILSILNSYFKG